MRLAGSTAFITGGASGIGRGLALALGSRGSRLMLADLDGDALEATAAELRAAGLDVGTVVCDVADRDAVFAAAEAAVDHLGRVDLVVNNAGVSVGGPAGEVTPEDFRWVMDVNFFGVVNGVEAFLPHLQTNGGGHILNTASLAGHLAGPGMGVYASSKFAVVGYSEALRAELAGQGIGVSVLCPAWVRTGISDSHLRRPSGSPPPGADDENVQLALAMVQGGLDPEALGDWAAQSLEAGRFWIFTHPEYRELAVQRHAEIQADWAAAEQAQTELAQTEPAQTEPAPTEPAQTEPAQTA